jgi:hypothetical protein
MIYLPRKGSLTVKALPANLSKKIHSHLFLIFHVIYDLFYEGNCFKMYQVW